MTVDAGATRDLDSVSFAGVDHKGAFARPLIGSKLTDTWGAARSGGRSHEGIDIFAPSGTPIHAIAGGTVVQGFTSSLGGNVVRIQGDDGRYYYYAHLKDGSFDHLEVGEHVRAGQVIGGVGKTGNATGTPNHLHLQVREDGEWINPFPFLKELPELPAAMAGAVPETTGTAMFAIDQGAPPSVADADQDGLIDQFEALFGTDPGQADTDRDALTDAYETAVSHTDPLKGDTDDDGVTDAHELAAGSDPGRAVLPDAVLSSQFAGLQSMDTDADGLSDAYENRIGTDRAAVDSDRDGLADVTEVAAGSNPLLIDSDQDGLTDAFETAQGTIGQGTIGQGTIGQDDGGPGMADDDLADHVHDGTQ